MTCVTLVKAALARFLFAIHALMTIWRVVQQEGDDYWKLAVGILCLLGEGTLQNWLLNFRYSDSNFLKLLTK